MTTNSVSKERAEGHYWARWGTSANWDVMFWRGGHFWDQQDCGYLPDNFGEIGPQVFPPTSSGGVTSGEVVTDEMVERAFLAANDASNGDPFLLASQSMIRAALSSLHAQPEGESNHPPLDQPQGVVDPLVLLAQLQAAKRENERLRRIVSDCAAALPNGAFIAPNASLEFMAKLPAEIASVTTRLSEPTHD